MPRLIHALLPVTVVSLLSAPAALADWNIGDGHKMHYPQLPDPNGWDVDATYYEALADDWQCSETGPVQDIHFWGSWKDDLVGDIDFFHIKIWSDQPAQGIEPSRPLQELWHGDFYPGDFTIREVTGGNQGWYDPYNVAAGGPVVEPGNHTRMFQYNINDVSTFAPPFIQQQGEIYWLEISTKLAFGSQAQWGWKSSLDHFNDDAFWGHSVPTEVWMEELYEPFTTQSLDLAFVITPEPSTLAAFALGGLALLRRRA